MLGSAQNLRQGRWPVCERRDERGRYVRGTSGNPRGRPPMPARQRLLLELVTAADAAGAQILVVVPDLSASSTQERQAGRGGGSLHAGPAATPASPDREAA